MDWATLGTLLLGSGISLVASIVMFTLAYSVDRKKRAAEDRRYGANAALAGAHKLMHTLNYVENLGIHVDKEFSDPERNEGMREPSSWVRPIIGIDANFAFVSIDEMSFLFASDGELTARVYEIQQRALVLSKTVESYNKLRFDYLTFIEGHASNVDGSVLTADLTGRDAVVAGIRLGRLNQLIAALVTQLDEDRPIVRQVVDDFIAEARSFYGGEFPAKRIEDRK